MVVVIDDDPSVRRALRRLLRGAMMDVTAYPSGEEFLAAEFPSEPDCLVLDIRMPGMTGPQLRHRLHQDGRRIPIVFITAHGPDPNDPPLDDVETLRKPFDRQTLLQAIHRATGPPPL